MAAGEGAQLPATIAASRCVEKSLEEATGSGALNLSNRKLKEFPRTARNYDLSDITTAGELCFCLCFGVDKCFFILFFLNLVDQFIGCGGNRGLSFVSVVVTCLCCKYLELTKTTLAPHP
jgi:hypothetical protein